MKALRDYTIPRACIPQVIRRSSIQANNFELKPITLQLIQNIKFTGLLNEDPNTHISNFLKVCDIVKYNGVSSDAIRFILFPFSLKDKAKWYLLVILKAYDTFGRVYNMAYMIDPIAEAFGILLMWSRSSCIVGH